MPQLFARDLLALVASAGLACGPWCGFQGTDHSYVIDHTCSGAITEPADVSLPDAVPADCGPNSEECTDTGTCMSNSSACTRICLGFEAPAPPPNTNMLQVQLTVAAPLRRGPVTLPDANVTVFGTLWGTAPGAGPMTLQSGTVSTVLTQDHLDVRYTLTFATRIGELVTATDVHYQGSGHDVAQCHVD